MCAFSKFSIVSRKTVSCIIGIKYYMNFPVPYKGSLECG